MKFSNKPANRHTLARTALCLLAMVICIATSPAQADLIPEVVGGVSLVYDTDRNITWLADANYARTSNYDSDGQMSWSAAKQWADNLVLEGYNDWRLPTVLPIDSSCSEWNTNGGGNNCTGGELDHLFYQELGGQATQSILTTHNANFNFFSNIEADTYWSGVLYHSSVFAWYFNFAIGAENVDFNPPSGGEHFAWAVRDGNVTQSLPEPDVFWLIDTGLLGWSATRVWRRK